MKIITQKKIKHLGLWLDEHVYFREYFKEIIKKADTLQPLQKCYLTKSAEANADTSVQHNATRVNILESALLIDS